MQTITYDCIIWKAKWDAWKEYAHKKGIRKDNNLKPSVINQWSSLFSCRIYTCVFLYFSIEYANMWTCYTAKNMSYFILIIWIALFVATYLSLKLLIEHTVYMYTVCTYIILCS